jgi:hypothetical protein
MITRVLEEGCGDSLKVSILRQAHFILIIATSLAFK